MPSAIIWGRTIWLANESTDLYEFIVCVWKSIVSCLCAVRCVLLIAKRYTHRDTRKKGGFLPQYYIILFSLIVAAPMPTIRSWDCARIVSFSFASIRWLYSIRPDFFMRNANTLKDTRKRRTKTHKRAQFRLIHRTGDNNNKLNMRTNNRQNKRIKMPSEMMELVLGAQLVNVLHACV